MCKWSNEWEEFKEKQKPKHLEVLNRYINVFFSSITASQRYKKTICLGVFFVLFPVCCQKKKIAITAMDFLCSSRLLRWKLSSGHDRRERGDSKVEKKKKRKERKAGGGGSRGGSGASYTCASLTSDKRIFQPTGAYRVHESTGQCRKGGWQKRDKDWEGLKWAGFCVTTWRSGRISFYPQCTDSKEFLLRRHLFLFLETVFFLSVSEADWESCSFFVCFKFFWVSFF